VKIELLYFDGCPNCTVADERLRALADDLGITVAHHKVETPEEAEEMGFRGSPTILVDGRDPFARGDEPVGLSCRIYQTPDGLAGSPTTEQLQTALAPGVGP
jgi:glutaredoxin